MRSRNLRKWLAAMLTGLLLVGHGSCLPTRAQINSTISSGITGGIQLGLVFGIESLLNQVSSSLGNTGT